MAIGKGFGKVILFGEHFVVYGLPGIASRIDKYVRVEINTIEENDIIFNDKIFREIVSKKDNPTHILCRLFDVMFSDLNPGSLKITITGNCLPRSGMGYSAALNVALARAINSFLHLKWNDKKISEIAYKGEGLIHGTPSGIDNTCATYGSLVWFEKDMEGGKNKIILFKPGKPIFFVLGNTKIKHDTKKSIDLVRNNKEKNPDLFDKIFSEEKSILSKAKIAIEKEDTEEIGLLMNKNQELLRKIGVSCKELEILIEIALKNGTLGAKLIGAGRGGLMIALCRNIKQQGLIVKAYKKCGFDGTKIKIK